jgi:hypothetical protein
MAKRTSMILSKRQSVVRSKSVEVPKLQIGDNVCVDLPEVALKEVQRGHGGWSMRMKEVIFIIKFFIFVINIVCSLCSNE